MQAKERLQKLEHLYLNGVQQSDNQAFSLETLLDILVVLYDECCSSTLRREKSVSEFVEFAGLLQGFSVCRSFRLLAADYMFSGEIAKNLEQEGININTESHNMQHHSTSSPANNVWRRSMEYARSKNQAVLATKWQFVSWKSE